MPDPFSVLEASGDRVVLAALPQFFESPNLRYAYKCQGPLV